MNPPYRVDRRVHHDGYHRYTSYVIEQTGVGVLCRGDDPVFMHRVVDLLNKETSAPRELPAAPDRNPQPR